MQKRSIRNNIIITCHSSLKSLILITLHKNIQIHGGTTSTTCISMCPIWLNKQFWLVILTTNISNFNMHQNEYNQLFHISSLAYTINLITIPLAWKPWFWWSVFKFFLIPWWCEKLLNQYNSSLQAPSSSSFDVQAYVLLS